jgi:hypothetical protein
MAISVGYSRPGQAMTLPPPDAVIAGDVLKGASWLVCDFTPDAAPGMPAGMRWDPREKVFKLLTPSADVSKIALLFDDEKNAALLVPIESGSLFTEVTYRTSRVIHGPPSNYGLLLEFDFGKDPTLKDAALMVVGISRKRTADDRIAAFFQDLYADMSLSFGPWARQSAMACSPAAGNGLKQQIEKARADWLGKPAAAKP